MDLEKELTQSIISIAKYGGFYIGRYETGSLSGEAVVKRMNTDIRSQTWYTMYEKCKRLRGANENVVTSMIFGSQFDRTLMWIIESGDKTKEQVATNSKEWGIYSNATLKYDSTGDGEQNATHSGNYSTIPAGASEQTKADNIYDLCGNVYDWTIETYSTNFRVLRGGDFLSNTTAKYRYYSNPSNNGGLYGCRAVLFIR